MKFIPENIYHIYNEGNNKQVIFNCHDDYITFIKKIRTFLLPHLDFIAYCLMPNHFHFLVHTDDRCNILIKQGDLTIDPPTNGIRKLLSNYARIFNERYHRSGSLFRQKTKAKCLSDKTGFTIALEVNDYCFNCFNYIHQNPYKAGLVSFLEDWEYSSFNDYAGLRNGTICNKQLAIDHCSFNINTFKKESYFPISNDWVQRIF